jgi:hypothetical protein
MSSISSENKIITDLSAALTSGQDSQSILSGEEGKNFAAMFSDILKEQATSQLSDAASLGSLSSGNTFSLPSSTGTDEAAINSLLLSLAGGKELDPELAMVLLFELMSSESGSDLSMLSSLLGSTTATNAYSTTYGTTKTAGNAQDAYKTLFSGNIQSMPTYSTGTAFEGTPGTIPQNGWVAVTPYVTSDLDRRSAQLYNEVIGQFDVETNIRYTPYKRGNDTYCNIFVWDVTRAMGAEIPHYVDLKTGAPRYYPDVSGAYELDANGVYDWLTQNGKQYGWIEVSAETAQEYANKGCPAVTAWKNSDGGAGHVQVVCPSKNGGYDEIRGVTVAQSGRHNYEYAYISSTVSAGKLPEVRYFVHA